MKTGAPIMAVRIEIGISAEEALRAKVSIMAIKIAPKDIRTMASSLKRLLTDPQECQYLGNKAYEHAMSHFNPQTLTEQLYKLYQSLIEN